MQLKPSILLLLVLAATPTAAQQGASLQVAVEILPSTLTLSVSSSRLDFGQIGANGKVEVHPESGAREGDARAPHSTAGILLTGIPGTPVTVQVIPPAHFTTPPPGHPSYELRWAHSHECTQTGFVQLPANPILTEEIGESGCSQIRFGGVIAANQAPPGRYAGEMTVLITQF